MENSTAKIKQMADSQYSKNGNFVNPTKILTDFIQFARWPLMIRTVSFTHII